MDDNACVFILLITKQINTEKQLNGVKHCVRRQITFLNLQQSFCDSVHLVYYEYNKKNREVFTITSPDADYYDIFIIFVV